MPLKLNVLQNTMTVLRVQRQWT